MFLKRGRLSCPSSLSHSLSQILNTGVRVFARVQAGDRLIFRPAEDGLSLVVPFITKRRVGASESDVARILSMPLAANGQAHPLESFSDDLQAQIQAMRDLSGTGPVVLVPTAADSTVLALPVWIGDKSVVLLADKLAQKRLANSLVQ